MRGSSRKGGRSPAPRVAGFTLTEVLVALLVLSIGMLGIASMYSQSLGAGRTARYRAQAVNLMTDLADKIRVNRLGQVAYAGAAVDHNCDPANGGGVDCSPDEMASHDLLVWRRQLAELLPGGQGRVQYQDGTDPPTYTIEVSWEQVGQGRIQAQIDIQVPIT